MLFVIVFQKMTASAGLADVQAVQLAQAACVHAWSHQGGALSKEMVRIVAKWCHAAPPLSARLLQACR